MKFGMVIAKPKGQIEEKIVAVFRGECNPRIEEGGGPNLDRSCVGKKLVSESKNLGKKKLVRREGYE